MWWTWGTLVPISRWSIRHRLFFRSSNWNWFCGDIYRIYCWYALNTFSSFLSPNSSTAFQIFKSLRLEDFPPWWMTSGNTDYWKLMWKWIKLKHGCFFLWNRLLTSLLFTNKKTLLYPGMHEVFISSIKTASKDSKWKLYSQSGFKIRTRHIRSATSLISKTGAN